MQVPPPPAAHPHPTYAHTRPPMHTYADYMNKKQFLDNFWEGFREVLGPNHTIKSLAK